MGERANWVRPDGTLINTTARGLFWGNRGALLDARGFLTRHHRGRGWVVCLLQFHDRHRVQWQPGRLTELYFLDEATALAAGHRPCGECRHADYRQFADAWRQAHPDDLVGARPIDARLHHDRMADRPAVDGAHRRYRSALPGLPNGTMIIDNNTDDVWLVEPDSLAAWTPGGYRRRRARHRGEVDVITPRSTVATLAAGFRPILHPSAHVNSARP